MRTPRGRPAIRVVSGLAGLVALAAAIGCGKVGAPRLPDLALPLQPEPVEVRNVADGFEVTFRRPREYLDGVPLDDLGSFEVTRSCEPTPGWIAVADIPVVDQGRFQKQGRVTFVDFDPRPGQTCVYRVVAVTIDDYRSAPAESAPTLRVVPSPTPTPPLKP